MEGLGVLQTVFDYIFGILAIIKDAFAQLFPQDNGAEGEAEAEPTV